MAARDSMAELITDARRLAHAGTADHAFSWGTYWSDEHIQEVLDRYRTTLKRLPITPIPEYTGGSYIYEEYPFPDGVQWPERGSATVDAAAGFAIRDSNGDAAPANTVNWDARLITFDDDQDADTFYLDVRDYNMERAVADIWEAKAGFWSQQVDWQSDNHRIAASQKAEHALKMAAKFRRMGGVSSATMVRRDVAR